MTDCVENDDLRKSKPGAIAASKKQIFRVHQVKASLPTNGFWKDKNETEKIQVDK